MTDGKHLLRYHKFLFSLGYKVQPIAIKCTWPFSVVNRDTLFAPTWHNVLWFFIMPYTTWELNCLPSVSINENETPEEFANRVQFLTAKVLNEIPTSYFKKDKVFLFYFILNKKALAIELYPRYRRTVRYRMAINHSIQKSYRLNRFGTKKVVSFSRKIKHSFIKGKTFFGRAVNSLKENFSVGNPKLKLD